MKKLKLLKNLVLLLMLTSVFLACNKDETKIVGYEVSGSSIYDGTYLEDVTYTKGPKFVHKENDNYALRTYTDDSVEMWCLIINNNTIYYKTPKTGSYPPESGWTCGLGVDKPNFKVTPVYE